MEAARTLLQDGDNCDVTATRSGHNQSNCEGGSQNVLLIINEFGWY